MARFQLGSIVTRISGSIGGTTFRKVGAIDVISNKSYGGSRSVLLSNASLISLRRVTQGWWVLPSVVRSLYSAFASSTLIPDGFGGEKYLTGRQMYIKLQSLKYMTNTPFIDTDGLRAFLGVASLLYIEYDVTSADGSFAVDDVFQNTFFFLSFEVLKNVDSAPSFTRRKKYYVGVTSSSFTFDVSAVIALALPNISLSSIVRVYVSYCNDSGFSSPQYLMNLTIK